MALLTWLLVLGFISQDETAASKPASVAAAQPRVGDREDETRILLTRCPIEYDKVTTIGTILTGTAGLGGKIETITVRRGDHVKAGQVMGNLYDEDLKIELRRLETELASDVTVRLAESKRAMYTAKLQHSKSLTQRNRSFVSEEDMMIDQYNLTESELTLEQAKAHLMLVRLSRDRIEADIRVRQFVAPHDGTVVEILKNPGESIAGNEPILKIVDESLLRVTGFADASDAWRIRPGQIVKIMPDLNGLAPEIEKQEFLGKVVFVDSRIDKESQTFPFMTEVSNRQFLLISGLECRMIVFLDDAEHPTTPSAKSPGRISPDSARSKSQGLNSGHNGSPARSEASPPATRTRPEPPK